MAHIIGVGIATLDIINCVAEYPDEDSEVRATSQRLERGGNATNTLVVLSQLGHQCSWVGVLSDEPDARRIIEDLNKYQIDKTHCRVVTGGKVPTSYITHNLESGSRTIIHHRDLPEYCAADFAQIDLSSCDWLHFEGRNVTETEKMLMYVAEHYPDLPCSLEIEKDRPNIKALFKYARVLVFSKHYVLEQELDNSEPARQFLKRMHRLFPEKSVICAWGEQGAYGIDQRGAIFQSAPCPPAKVIDTLGAGDTFNAAVIDSLLKVFDTEMAIANGCRIAGEKCGYIGLGFIK